jgi:hypothetical protein
MIGMFVVTGLKASINSMGCNIATNISKAIRAIMFNEIMNLDV